MNFFLLFCCLPIVGCSAALVETFPEGSSKQEEKHLSCSIENSILSEAEIATKVSDCQSPNCAHFGLIGVSGECGFYTNGNLQDFENTEFLPYSIIKTTCEDMWLEWKNMKQEEPFYLYCKYRVTLLSDAGVPPAEEINNLGISCTYTMLPFYEETNEALVDFIDSCRFPDCLHFGVQGVGHGQSLLIYDRGNFLDFAQWMRNSLLDDFSVYYSSISVDQVKYQPYFKCSILLHFFARFVV